MDNVGDPLHLNAPSLRVRLVCLLLLLSLSESRYASPQRIGTMPSVPPRYTLEDLGPLPRSASSAGPALNTRGEVAYAAQTPNIHTHARLRSSGSSEDLGALPDYPDTVPTGINAAGVVVGTAIAPGSALYQRPFVWKDRALTLLETGEGKYGEAKAINDRGEIVGSFTTGEKEVHACIWKQGRQTDLGVLGSGNASVAEDINASGAIVGASNTVRDGKNHAFLWQNGRMHELGLLPGGTQAHARAVNARGEAVGWSDDAEVELHAVVWRGGTIMALDTLGEDPSAAWGINDRGEIVGAAAVRKRMHACLWRKGTILDLNNLIPPDSGWALMLASSINNRGQIAGQGRYRGAVHAFLLTEAPPSRQEKQKP